MWGHDQWISKLLTQISLYEHRIDKPNIDCQTEILRLRFDQDPILQPLVSLSGIN